MNDKNLITALVLTVLTTLGCSGGGTYGDLPRVGDYESASVPAARKHLKVGVVPGPYGDMFMEAIYPSLKEMGYTAELVYYDNYTLPNSSLADGGIDLNIFQHYRYLVNYKFENDMSLSAVAEIPTASMGVFSKRHRSLGALPHGATVILPGDATNYARALMVLEDAGLIRLGQYIDKTKATSKDVILNPRGIRLVPREAHKLAGLLPEHDLAVINGNFAISGGLDLADALHCERLGGDYFNVIVVRTNDLDEQFVRDIVKVTRSDAYRQAIIDPLGKFDDFQRPRGFLAQMNRGG